MTSTATAPGYIAPSALLRAAYDLATDVHAAGQVPLRHPVAVATLLHDSGYPEHVIAAALLHDVVEDGGLGVEAIEQRFGPDVARLVALCTEDASIVSYTRRKAALRSRAVGDGAEADAPSARKLEHYERSLWLLKARHPELPFLAELESDLTRLRARA